MSIVLLCALTLWAANPLPGVDVGTFTVDRLYDTPWAVIGGSSMTVFKSLFESRGANWRETPTLNKPFLAGVKVFFTSLVNRKHFPPEEVEALSDWVRAGGTLVVTGECSCDGNQDAYNDLLAPFGVQFYATSQFGIGQAIAQHRITRGLSSVFVDKNAWVVPPPSATILMNDPEGHPCALVMEEVSEVGRGRLFVIGDTQMFSTLYLTTNASDNRLAANIASWALRTKGHLQGFVTAADYSKNLGGLPLDFDVYDKGKLIQTGTAIVGADGLYELDFPEVGSRQVVVKMPTYLSRRAAVKVGLDGRLDWQFSFNGDADHDDRIGPLDLTLLLWNYGQWYPVDSDANGDGTLDMLDIGLTISNFGRRGEP